MGITALSVIVSGFMFCLMIRNLIILAIILALSPCAISQGLKGARMPEKILGRLEYIKGNNDQERWKTFLQAQPKLIGMTFEQVTAVLGEGGCNPSRTWLLYGLTEAPVNSSRFTKPKWLHLTVTFRDLVALKYEVYANP